MNQTLEPLDIKLYKISTLGDIFNVEVLAKAIYPKLIKFTYFI